MKYQNPIIRGFNPDPSICRVGEDYYLVTSTFEFFPGIPVYHSRDLVNWTQIGHCIDRADQLPLDQAVTARGIWAPTIRYHEGTFYVTATCFGVGNFIVSTRDPAESWSDPVYVPIDGRRWRGLRCLLSKLMGRLLPNRTFRENGKLILQKERCPGSIFVFREKKSISGSRVD